MLCCIQEKSDNIEMLIGGQNNIPEIQQIEKKTFHKGAYIILNFERNFQISQKLTINFCF